MRVSPLLAALALLGSAPCAQAADLFSEEPVATLLRTETLTAEVFAGYVLGTAREYVRAVPGYAEKLSQLDWKTNAFALGGRVAFRPTDWLTIRARGWSTVAGVASMQDYDWLGGYYGNASWTHHSTHPDTSVAKSWMADISGAVPFYDAGDIAFTAIAGYRHFTQKWNAKGGSYIYSTTDFRDTAGTFPPGQLGIAYQQWWRTPYAGVGISTSVDNWSATAELIGSPFVMSEAKDHHVLRDLVIRDKFGLSGMVGIAASAEYRLSPVMSLTGRVEYQNYLGARGRALYADGGTGTSFGLQSPGAGADSETLMLSMGVKVRI